MAELTKIGENIKSIRAVREVFSNDNLHRIKFQVQYVDYEPNTWTIPINANFERIMKYTLDASVSKIKLIFQDKEEVFCF